MSVLLPKDTSPASKGTSEAPEGGGANAGSTRLDPLARQFNRLREDLANWTSSGATESTTRTPEPAPAAKPSRAAPAGRSRLSTILKSLAALVVVFSFGWRPIQRLLAVTSAEATVNARVITLRAPIEGEVSSRIADLDIGASFDAGDEILAIDNPRADHQHLDDLRQALTRAEQSLESLQGRRRIQLARHDELAAQQERFRLGRVEQLEKRLGEIDTEIASADADHLAAANALARSAYLMSKQIASAAAHDKAVRDERVTREAFNGALERRKAALVELEAAREKTYVGDSYNDTPRSAQALMEVDFDISDTDVRIAAARAETASLEKDVDDEIKRQVERSSATLRATTKGQIWELLTAPGEHVNRGQDLVRLLDCGAAIVTASVSESSYQNLEVGQSASFRPRNGDPVLSGWIVGLNGLAAVNSNSAIAQSALSREPYHVTLKFPAIEKATGCQVGQSGLVTFENHRSALASSDGLRLAEQ